MPDISDLIEEYKKNVKQMVPPDQAELVDTIIDLGLKIGASMALNLQAVQGTDNPEVIQSPPEDAPPQAIKCRRHCINRYKGACMIFNEGDICADTFLCDRYEKYTEGVF